MQHFDRPILVYGASGHTGRFVVRELQARGRRVVLSGRSRSKLEDLATSPELEVRAAGIDDPHALDEAAAGCAAVINCAGPFLETAQPLVEAALRARIPYLDVTAEQACAQATFDSFSDRARQAGVVVLPGMAFYGGLGDLLATAAMGDWPQADEIRIAIALDSWAPTEGTRATGRRNTAPRVVIRGGTLQPLELPARTSLWRFGGEFGEQEVVELPFTEVVLIARHLVVSDLHTLFSTGPLSDLRDPSTPPPTPADETGRSAQVFRVECEVRRGDACRRAAVSGRDIYAVTAPLVVEAMERVLGGKAVGVLAPGALLDAADLLRSLSPGALQFTPAEP
jgi:uncharacterized protein YbjT (DUF2867 family)